MNILIEIPELTRVDFYGRIRNAKEAPSQNAIMSKEVIQPGIPDSSLDRLAASGPRQLFLDLETFLTQIDPESLENAYDGPEQLFQLREQARQQVMKTPITGPDDWEELVRYFIGPKTEDIPKKEARAEYRQDWDKLDILYDFGGPENGEDFMILALVDKIRKTAQKNPDAITKEFIDSVIERIIERSARILREEWKLEKEMAARGELEIVNIGDEDDKDEPDYMVDMWEHDSDQFGNSLTREPILVLNQTMREIGCFGSERTIDQLIELIPKYGEDATKWADLVFSQINPDHAAARLLSLLRQKPDDNPESARKQAWLNRRVSRVLHRLEFGQIGISAEGVRYLERLYDLGEYNNPGYSVRRLTANGEIGVFDEERVLQKFFNLGDLSSEEKQVKATVLNFTLEQFFSAPAAEGSEERRQQEEILEEFKRNYFQFYDDEFFKDTGVRFNNLNFREQAWFMRFALRASAAEQEKALGFVRQYGEAGLKSFISLELDAQAGDKIFAIAENNSGRSAEKIFRKYESLVSLADEAEAEIRQFFVSAGGPERVAAQSVTGEILKRAAGMLAKFAEAKKGEEPTTEINQKLDAIRRDIVLFAAIFKTAFKGKERVDFSDVRGLDLQSSDSSRLGREDIAAMRRIFHDNRAELSPEFAEFRVREEFDPVMKEAGHKFYLLKKDGEIICFARFDELANGNLYTGFINTRPDVKGMAIGNAFLKEALAREAPGRGVELNVRTENPAQRLYARLGFAVIDQYINPKSGKEYVRMLRPAAAEEAAEELKEAA